MELMDRLKDMEKERDDWRQTASNQVECIKKLEEDIVPRSKQFSDANVSHPARSGNTRLHRIHSLMEENTCLWKTSWPMDNFDFNYLHFVKADHLKMILEKVNIKLVSS
ncbi:hypothetical protein Tco_1050938 [Tanacetum coccineum]